MDIEKEKYDITEASAEDMKANNCLAKEVTFDVVSSVKGGSGKSTYSLLLAAHYNMKPRSVAYILDLDLRGTSWETNYGRYIKTRFFESEPNSLDSFYSAVYEELPEDRHTDTADEKKVSEDIINKRRYYNQYPFINSLMLDFGAFQSKYFWSEIAFRSNTDSGIIRICPAKTDKGNDIDQIEVDVFEHTVGQIIRYILDYHRADRDLEEIHIILDMPPSYEKHAEAVVKHLLTSESSQLFREAVGREKLFHMDLDHDTAYYLPYKLRVFLLCAMNPAHLEQNALYLLHWLNDRKYSDGVIDLIKDKDVLIKNTPYSDTNMYITKAGRERFKVCFIINDVAGIIREFIDGKPEQPSSEQISEWIEGVSDQIMTEKSSQYRQVREEMEKIHNRNAGDLICLQALPHLLLPATYWYFDRSPDRSKSVLEIRPEMLHCVDHIIENL